MLSALAPPLTDPYRTALARHPVRIFRIVAGVALVVSVLNPLMLLAGVFPATGMTPSIFWTMMVMHGVSALITASLLTTLAVEP